MIHKMLPLVRDFWAIIVLTSRRAARTFGRRAQQLGSPDRKTCSFAGFLQQLEFDGVSGLTYRSSQSGNICVCISDADLQKFLTCTTNYFGTFSGIVRVRWKRSWLVITRQNAKEKRFRDVGWTPVLIDLAPRQDSIIFELEVWRRNGNFVSAPRRNNFFQRVWDSFDAQENCFSGGGFKNPNVYLEVPRTLSSSRPIDIVFTWVNNDDPDWLKLVEPYRPSEASDSSSPARFRSRDELRYSLRSICEHANFVRKVFIVSNCKPPDWLNIENSRLVWVWHEEILPESALPTFNSHAIETSLYKIPGLAEQFIYLNDDILFGRKCSAGDFFFSNGIEKARFEPYGNVIGEADPMLPDYLNAAINSRNLLNSSLGLSFTELITHSARPMKVSVWTEMSDQFFAPLESTMHNRFRSIDDINPCLLYAHYSVAMGQAVPDFPKTELIQSNHDYRHRFSSLIDRKRGAIGKLPSTICVNDGAGSYDDLDWDVESREFMSKYFPNPCDFEV